MSSVSTVSRGIVTVIKTNSLKHNTNNNTNDDHNAKDKKVKY